MSRAQKPNIARSPEDDSASRNSIPEAFRDLIASTLAYSDIAVCQECGSNSNLERATLSLWGTDQNWEITLPICEQCASRVNTMSASEGDKEGALQ